jgi:hypothetical protein
MKNYYDQLKSALSPPTNISLPHRATRKQRMNILKARVASLYDVDQDKEAVYKALHGQYSNGVIQYPFLFEGRHVTFLRYYRHLYIPLETHPDNSCHSDRISKHQMGDLCRHSHPS